MRARDHLAIGELARRTGLSVSAIRYYEAEGLLLAERNAGGQRRFVRSSDAVGEQAPHGNRDRDGREPFAPRAVAHDPASSRFLAALRSS